MGGLGRIQIAEKVGKPPPPAQRGNAGALTLAHALYAQQTERGILAPHRNCLGKTRPATGLTVILFAAVAAGQADGQDRKIVRHAMPFGDVTL